METFSRPPPRGTTAMRRPRGVLGAPHSNLPGPKGELFYGYYHSAATMVRDETGPPVPELARRITLSPAAT